MLPSCESDGEREYSAPAANSGPTAETYLESKNIHQCCHKFDAAFVVTSLMQPQAQKLCTVMIECYVAWISGNKLLRITSARLVGDLLYDSVPVCQVVDHVDVGKDQRNGNEHAWLVSRGKTIYYNIATFSHSHKHWTRTLLQRRNVYITQRKNDFYVTGRRNGESRSGFWEDRFQSNFFTR